LAHAGCGGVGRRLKHHEIDEAGDTFFARRERHRRGRVAQPVLYGVGEIDGRDVLHGVLDGADVKEVAGEYFRPEGFQPVRAFVDPANQGADRDISLKQHFGDVPAGLALGAPGR
jgi:hypothetical protein